MEAHKRIVGFKQYELANHLGNVIDVVTDKKKPVDANTDGITDYYEPTVHMASAYYPFGMQMPGLNYQGPDYRFGFNGKEKDDEWHGSTGTVYDYGFRIYNPRIGKFLSVDPLTKSYPWYTPYQFAGNTPIQAIDLDGLEQFIVTSWRENQTLKTKVEFEIIKESDIKYPPKWIGPHKNAEHRVLYKTQNDDGTWNYKYSSDIDMETMSIASRQFTAEEQFTLDTKGGSQVGISPGKYSFIKSTPFSDSDFRLTIGFIDDSDEFKDESSAQAELESIASILNQNDKNSITLYPKSKVGGDHAKSLISKRAVKIMKELTQKHHVDKKKISGYKVNKSSFWSVKAIDIKIRQYKEGESTYERE